MSVLAAAESVALIRALRGSPAPPPGLILVSPRTHI